MMKAPTTIPLLFDLPPITNAAQTRKVERAGDMNVGSNPVSFQAQNAPASPAMAALGLGLLLCESGRHGHDAELLLRPP